MRSGGVPRLGLPAAPEKMAAMATPSRRAARGGDKPSVSQQTPRQAAIAARKEMTERKQREVALARQADQEMKRIAKAQHEERMAEQQRSLRERSERAQRQRVATASAKKAAKQKQIELQANELQTTMKEKKEWREGLLQQEKERRRASLANRSAAWTREREVKRKQKEDRLKDQQMARDEASQVRRDRAINQAALDKAAAEERRYRRSSAQWRRNKKRLDASLERGMGKALDPLRLADEIFDRQESRKEEQEYRDAQRALRRESKEARRKSERRRRCVDEVMKDREKELEADLKASELEGMKDTAAYREACLRRERESLNGRRVKLWEDKQIHALSDRFTKAVDAEERVIGTLAREDVEGYKEDQETLRAVEKELHRQDQMRHKLYEIDRDLKKKEQEATERRIQLEDRESVSASKRREEEAERDRLEALREPPSEKTKLEILEAIWAKQTHPAAAAAARHRRQRPDLQTVHESSDSASSSPRHRNSCNNADRGDSTGRVSVPLAATAAPAAAAASAGTPGVGISTESSSSSGLGIAGRSTEGSSFDSLLDTWRSGGVAANANASYSYDGGYGRAIGAAAAAAGSPSSPGQSGIGLGGDVRLDAEDDTSGWADISLIEDGEEAEEDASPATVTQAVAAAASVLPAAEECFDTAASRENKHQAVSSTLATVGTKPHPEASSDFPVRMLVFPHISDRDAVDVFSDGGAKGMSPTAACDGHNIIADESLDESGDLALLVETDGHDHPHDEREGVDGDVGPPPAPSADADAGAGAGVMANGGDRARSLGDSGALASLDGNEGSERNDGKQGGSGAAAMKVGAGVAAVACAAISPDRR